jgi:hypothetical protein
MQRTTRSNLVVSTTTKVLPWLLLRGKHTFQLTLLLPLGMVLPMLGVVMVLRLHLGLKALHPKLIRQQLFE